jgi:hypothetical protein
MPSGSAYREKALACVAQAAQLHDPDERAAMLAIAGAYLKAAEHIDQGDERRRKSRAFRDRER